MRTIMIIFRTVHLDSLFFLSFFNPIIVIFTNLFKDRPRAVCAIKNVFHTARVLRTVKREGEGDKRVNLSPRQQYFQWLLIIHTLQCPLELYSLSLEFLSLFLKQMNCIYIHLFISHFLLLLTFAKEIVLQQQQHSTLTFDLSEENNSNSWFFSLFSVYIFKRFRNMIRNDAN